MPDSAPLSIRLFGPCVVEVDGGTLPDLRSRKGYWLLALLAMQKRPVSRKWLLQRLWPESGSAESGRDSLRTSLRDLTKAMGGQGTRLVPTRDSLYLDLHGAEVDVIAFDAAIAQDDTPSLETAVGLYRGPLLEDCEDPWVLPERVVREQAVLKALNTLSQRELADGAMERAVRHLRLAMAHAPEDQYIALKLMELLNHAEDFNGVADVYHELRNRRQGILGSDGVPPDIARLYQQIKARARHLVARRRSAVEMEWSPPIMSLPAPTTSFVGREDARREVAALLISDRLVSLTGMGGIGKTRLAIQVGSDVADEYPDGVWFVELASLSEPERLPQSIAATLKLADDPSRPVYEALLGFLSKKRMLIILDNCEHIRVTCAALTSDILSHCQHLRVLTTTREALNLRSERVYPVPPLSLPSKGRHKGDAVRLFLERMPAVRPEQQFSHDDTVSVEALCQRLEGFPLSLELAASWANVLTPSQMLSRFPHPLDLPESHLKDVPQRHSSLSAVMEVSWDLLESDVRRFLTLMSIFRGGWDLGAAEAISKEGSAFKLLAELSDRSWITSQANRGGIRFQMLATLREFVARRLAPEEAAALSRCHAEYFLGVAQSADPRLSVDLDRMEYDLDNMRAALAWAGEHRVEYAALGLALAERLCPFWSARGHLREACLRLTEILAWPEAVAASERAARLCLGLGLIQRNLLNYAASEAAYQTAESMAEILGLPSLRAEAANGLGNICWNRDRLDEARNYYEAALAQPSESVDRGVRAITLENLGNYWGKAGQYENARKHYEGATSLFVAAGNPRGAARVDHNHAVAAKAYGRFDVAVPLFERSLVARWEVRDAVSIAYSLEGIADVLHQRGLITSSVILLGAADALRTAIAATRPQGLDAAFAALLNEAKGVIGEEKYGLAWEKGKAMQPPAEADPVPLPGEAIHYAQAALAQATLTLSDKFGAS